MMLGAEIVIILAVVGSVAGVLGGLLGIGGSIVMIPAMLFIFGDRFGPEGMHLFQAAAMIVNFFVAISSAYRHYKAGALFAPTLKGMIPAAAVGSVAGVFLANLFTAGDTIWLVRIFGGFMLYVMAYNVWRMIRKQMGKPGLDRTPPASRAGGWRAGLVGVPVGLGGGLLGIGGGVVAVPLQQMAMKMPLQRAIGNSSATIVFVALFGAIAKNVTLGQHVGAGGDPFSVWQSLTIAGVLIPTAFVGAYIGAHLTHTMPLGALRVAFAGLMLYAGLRLVMRQAPVEPEPSVARAEAGVVSVEHSRVDEGGRGAWAAIHVDEVGRGDDWQMGHDI